jgi:small neutral amino acid transporter SnatA (MarC family)
VPTTEAREQQRWANRRRMAWLTLVMTLAYPFLPILGVGKEVILGLSAYVYTFAGSIVLAYIGVVTIDDQLKEWRPNKDATRETANGADGSGAAKGTS